MLVAVHTSCRWGIIFGGDSYVIVHFQHLPARRPIVYVSEIIPFSQNGQGDNDVAIDFNTHLPLWSAMLYTFLATPESEERLLEGTVPVPLPDDDAHEDLILEDNRDPVLVHVSLSASRLPVSLCLSDCPSHDGLNARHLPFYDLSVRESV